MYTHTHTHTHIYIYIYIYIYSAFFIQFYIVLNVEIEMNHFFFKY